MLDLGIWGDERFHPGLSGTHAVSGYKNLPFWDLYAALHPAGKLSGWELDPDTEARMVRAHLEFVDHALAELVGTNGE